MTREEAIKMLRGMKADNLNLDDLYTKDKYEALDMAIKALEQEPCEDCLSRKAVLDTLDTTDKFLDEDRTVENYKALLKECYEVLTPVTPPSEDCVSRQAVIDALDKRFDSVPMEQTTEILLLRKDLRELPPVTPTHKKGI